MNAKQSRKGNIWRAFRIIVLLLVLILSLGNFSPAINKPILAQTVSQPSHNVAIVGSVFVQNGGSFPTTTTGPTGSFLDFNFFILPRLNLSLTSLEPGGVCGADGCDTVLLNVASSNMGCNINNLTSQQKADLVSFVNLGRKLIIYDSECVTQDYSWLPYPFTTVNPGALGAQGTLTIVEENTLSSGDPTSPYYINAGMLGTQTDAVGDMNVMTTYDPNWFLDMSGTNAIGFTGPVHTYASLPPGTDAGLIIYNGLDVDYMNTSTIPDSATPAGNLAKIWLQELQQLFNPSDLPGTNPVIGVALTPENATLNVGANHTVTATITDLLGVPQTGIQVTFSIDSGPNAGTAGTCSTNSDCTTDANGQVNFTYTGNAGIGIDQIKGCINKSTGQVVCSQHVMVEWIPQSELVILVHGWNQNSAEIASTQAEIDEGGNVLFFDLTKALIAEFGELAVFQYHEDRSVNGDSQSAIDDNVNLLAAQIENVRAVNPNKKISLIGFSMGTAIIRGYLAQYPNAEQNVDAIVFMEGAHQGSFWFKLDQGLSDMAVANLIAHGDPSWALIVSGIHEAAFIKSGIDTNRPAARDLTPQSQWYKDTNKSSTLAFDNTTNTEPVPPQVSYYNFYGDIRVHLAASIGKFHLKAPSVSFGDTALLPGDDKPTAKPLLGGARFLTSVNSDQQSEQWGMIYDYPLSMSGLIRFIKGEDSASEVFDGLLSTPVAHSEYKNNMDIIFIDDRIDGSGNVSVVQEIVNIIRSHSE